MPGRFKPGIVVSYDKNMKIITTHGDILAPIDLKDSEVLTLELSDGSVVRGFILDDYIERRGIVDGYYIYDIRHSDDTLDLATIESKVVVNRECSILLEDPIKAIESGDYLEIVDWKYSDIETAIYETLNEKFGDIEENRIEEFLSQEWSRRAQFKETVAEFKRWITNN